MIASSPLIAGSELGGTMCNCSLATGPDDIRDEVRMPTTAPGETHAAIKAVLARWEGYEALGIASIGPVSIDRAAADYGSITATTKAGWSNTDVARRGGRNPHLVADIVGPGGEDTIALGAAELDAGDQR